DIRPTNALREDGPSEGRIGDGRWARGDETGQTVANQGVVTHDLCAQETTSVGHRGSQALNHQGSLAAPSK
ncbi:hypothetical protein S245_039904, partial [Arachis hypogaea]